MANVKGEWWFGRGVDVTSSCTRGRIFHYLRFLRSNAFRRFSHVLLTDVRDVAFQSDPFDGLPSRCLWLFQECSAFVLANEQINRCWIESAYGASGFRRIQENGILCSGTTLGSTDLIVKYLSLMARELIRLTPVIRGSFGYDQGVENWLYWTGLLPEAEVKQNFLGPVATLELEPLEGVPSDAQGRILNRSGNPTPVLHQYDRRPALLQRITAQVATAKLGGTGQ